MGFQAFFPTIQTAATSCTTTFNWVIYNNFLQEGKFLLIYLLLLKSFNHLKKKGYVDSLWQSTVTWMSVLSRQIIPFSCTCKRSSTWLHVKELPQMSCDRKKNFGYFDTLTFSLQFKDDIWCKCFYRLFFYSFGWGPCSFVNCCSVASINNKLF